MKPISKSRTVVRAVVRLFLFCGLTSASQDRQGKTPLQKQYASVTTLEYKICLATAKSLS